MNVHEKLNQLLNERGWTKYRLAKESNLPIETITSIFHRGTNPSIATLESICAGFRITLGQFFSDNELVDLTPELQTVFKEWSLLTPCQKDAILVTMKAMHNEQ